MKKIILLLIGTIFSVTLSAQSKTKIEYSASGMYYCYADTAKAGKKDGEIPAGRDVQIFYDTFFKSWDIAFIDKEGKKQASSFYYVYTESDNSTRCSDDFQTPYTVYNNIETKGTIRLVSHNLSGQYIFSVLLKDVVKK